MNEKTLELFIQNYKNEGICKDLPNFKKSFEKKFKDSSKTINFYPWAVIERLFRMQGGKISVAEWVFNVPISYTDYEVNPQDGTATPVEKTNNAVFMKLVGEWQGEVLEELYPIFDNQNAKIIKTPDALDLNTTKQRGSVRLIGRLSGIGLDIFEQQEQQFEADTNTPEKLGGKVVVNTKEDHKGEEAKVVETTTKKGKDKKVQQEALKSVIEETLIAEQPKEVEHPQPQAPITKAIEETKKVEENPTPQGLSNFLSGAAIEPKNVETAKPQVQQHQTQPSSSQNVEEYENGSEQHADLLMKVREALRKNGTQAVAKEFYKSKGRELLSALTYSELTELLPKL